MKRNLIRRNKSWLTIIYKSSSSQHVPMHDEIEFLKASNRKRNVIRVEKRHPSVIDWVNTQFYEGYAVVQCYDWKGKFAYEAYLYSIEQLPLLLTPFWIPCKLDNLLSTR